MSSNARLGVVVFAAAGGVFLLVCGAVVVAQRGGPATDGAKVFEKAPDAAADWTYTDLADHLRGKGLSPLTVIPAGREGVYFVFAPQAPSASTMEALPHGDSHYPPYLRVVRWESPGSLRLELSRQGDPADKFGWGRWCFYGDKDWVARVRAALTG